jgi:hypothetical protein
VLRWSLPYEPVLYDFVEHVREAHVVRVENGVDHPCVWQASGRPTGGGLGAGPITPAERWQCDFQRNWLWVGATVEEDLTLRARRCVWQHPSGNEPIRVSYPNVPLGQRLVLYGDIYYEHERERTHGPLDVVVRVDGEEVGRMRHFDGDGFKRMEASTAMSDRRERGTVSIEVTAPDPNLRTFCWIASTRGRLP